MISVSVCDIVWCSIPVKYFAILFCLVSVAKMPCSKFYVVEFREMKEVLMKTPNITIKLIRSSCAQNELEMTNQLCIYGLLKIPGGLFLNHSIVLSLSIIVSCWSCVSFSNISLRSFHFFKSVLVFKAF